MLFVVGPSHVPRWRHVIETLGYPRPAKDLTFVGDGGYPVWNLASFARVQRDFKAGDKVYLIVGDFRFGNRRLNEWPFSSERIFENGYTHVERDLIGAQNDQRMKALCLAALAKWREAFGDDLFVLHWTLAMQAVQCRIEGRYLDRGVLVHPSWNVVEFSVFANDVEGLWRFADPDATKLKSLFVDRDLHPSALGYLYLTEVFKLRNSDKAFSSAFQAYRVAFDRIFRTLEQRERRRVLITGDSYAIEVMDRAVPYEFRARLESLGIKLAFKSSRVDNSLVASDVFDETVFVSAFPFDDDTQIGTPEWERIRQRFQGIAKRTIVVPWEAMYRLMTTRRGRYSAREWVPLSDRELAFLSDAAELDYVDLIELGSLHRMMEHGAGGAPTLEGIFFILSLAGGARRLLVKPFGNPDVLSG